MQLVERPLQPALTRIWTFLRDEIPYLLQLMMDISILIPLFLAFAPWARLISGWELILWGGALILLPFNLLRLMSLLRVSLARQQLMLLVLLVFFILFSVQRLLFAPLGFFNLTWVRTFFFHFTLAGYPFWLRSLLVIGMVLIFWWRGIRLITRVPSIDSAGLRFRLFALLLAPIAIFLASRTPQVDLTPYLLLFGFSSLLVIALTRAQEVERQSTGLVYILNGRWLTAVLAAALLVVVFAALLGGAAGTDTLASPPQIAIRQALVISGLTSARLIFPIFFAIITPVTELLTWLLAPLAELIAEVDLQFLEPPPPELGAETAEEQLGFSLSWLPGTVVTIFFIIFVLAVTFSATRIFSRLRERVTDELDETAVAGRRGAFEGEEGSQGFFGGLLDRLRGVIPGLGKLRMVYSIRRVYRLMGNAATHFGYPRGESVTPYEYAAELEALWPDNRAEIDLITTAFVNIRYGQLPESRRELEAIVHAWELLEQQIQAGVKEA